MTEADRTVRWRFWAVMTALFVLLLWLLNDILLPFVVGMVVAYFLDPVVSRLQRLGLVPAVKGVAVRSLETDRADLRLEYFGSMEDLQRTLASAGLSLDKEADKWRLQAR